MGFKTRSFGSDPLLSSRLPAGFFLTRRARREEDWIFSASSAAPHEPLPRVFLLKRRSVRRSAPRPGSAPPATEEKRKLGKRKTEIRRTDNSKPAISAFSFPNFCFSFFYFCFQLLRSARDLMVQLRSRSCLSSS